MKRASTLWLAGFGVVVAAGIAVVWPVYRCYDIPAHVSNPLYQANLAHAQRQVGSASATIDAGALAEWRRALEAVPLVARAVYRGGEVAGRGTWRVEFQAHEDCFAAGDVLEFEHTREPDGTLRMQCRFSGANRAMRPFACKRRD